MSWSELMLSRTPTWETAYQGRRGDRYAEHDGRYFEVHASAETGWLFVDRIDSAGRYLGESTAVIGDAAAKAIIREWHARGVIPDEAFDGPHLRTLAKREAHQRATERKAAWRQAEPEAYRAEKDRELAARRARTAAKRQRQGDQGVAA